MPNDTVTEFVRCTFTEEEKQALASTMANNTLRLQDLDAEKKSVMSEFKDRIEKVQLEVNRAAMKLKDGFEMRPIECEKVKDFDAGVVRFIAVTTGEEMDRRPMTAEDRQMDLDDGGPF